MTESWIPGTTLTLYFELYYLLWVTIALGMLIYYGLKIRRYQKMKES